MSAIVSDLFVNPSLLWSQTLLNHNRSEFLLKTSGKIQNTEIIEQAGLS